MIMITLHLARNCRAYQYFGTMERTSRLTSGSFVMGATRRQQAASSLAAGVNRSMSADHRPTTHISTTSFGGEAEATSPAATRAAAAAPAA